MVYIFVEQETSTKTKGGLGYDLTQFRPKMANGPKFRTNIKATLSKRITTAMSLYYIMIIPRKYDTSDRSSLMLGQRRMLIIRRRTSQQ